MPTKSSNASKAPKEEKRSRSWATIIYPESSPDFEQKIRALMLEGFISPLHTDIDEEKQLEKKPHRHFLMQFPSVKSYTQVKEICDQFGGAGAECVSNTRAYARYLCHLDQPNKKQYDPAEVIPIGAEDYFNLIEAPSTRYQVVRDMQAFCESHKHEIGYSLARLMDYAAENNESWFRHLCDDCCYVMKAYLKSKERDMEQAQANHLSRRQAVLSCIPSGHEFVDLETGEQYKT